MPLTPLNIPPGVFRNGTQYQTAGRWYDANLVRWIDGLLLPVGGWSKMNSSAFAGVCRGLFAWRDNLFARYLALGTNTKLYAWNDSGTLFDITPAGFNPGRVDAIYGGGYGYGVYGGNGTTVLAGGTYGTPRTVGVTVKLLEAATWMFDNWGEYLVGCAPHDGKIYEWALNTASVATAVTNAPASNRGVFVTPERHLVALGAGGDPRKVQWSSQEDRNNWSPSATSTAGDFELQTNGVIQSARRLRGQNLIFTTLDVHTMTYVGMPYVYGFERAGSFCGAAGPNAIAAAESFCVWMGNESFYMFDGALRTLPCDVRDYVFGDINSAQLSKVYAGINSKFSEVWWFYPSANSTENDRYVLWNWRENHWSIGALSRTAWTSGGIFSNPIAANASGYIYSHENGWTNDGAALTSTRYAESGAIEIGNGDQVSIVRQMLPDERTQGQTRAKFKTRFTPEGPETTHGPYSMSNYTDVRFTGRQVAVRVEGNSDADWRVGTPRIEVVPGGRR